MYHNTSHRIGFLLIALFGGFSMLHMGTITNGSMPPIKEFENLRWDSSSTALSAIDIPTENIATILTTQPFLGTTTDSTASHTCIRSPDIQFFMYHYVREHDKRDNTATRDLSIDPRDFRTHMRYIEQLRDGGKIHTMNGSDFLKALQKNCFPGEHIWIFTSDDAWSDTYSNLFPIASEYGVPFFLGVIEGRIDTPGFVTSSHVREMAKNPLFTISSHSMSHGQQNVMTKETERYEICESKKILEQLIQQPVLTYIYPEGRMSKNSQILAQECGYLLAWSTGYGTKWNPEQPSRYDINRNRIHNSTTIELFRKLSERYQ